MVVRALLFEQVVLVLLVLLLATSCSEHDMAVLPVLVVQLLAVAKEEGDAAVSAVPEDRGVMTVHLGGVRHMGCGDVVVDQFRLGFIVTYSIFD